MSRDVWGMSRYVRMRVPGGTYFFTVRLQDRGGRLLTDRIALLRDCVRLCRRRLPFEIEVAVVLPDHLHMIWTLPPDDDDFSARWRMIKSTFSRHNDRPALIRPSQIARGEKGIWQRRFWEHLIRDEADFDLYRAYALTAPVRAGLAPRPQDWPYSSIHRDLARTGPSALRLGTGGISALRVA